CLGFQLNYYFITSMTVLSPFQPNSSRKYATPKFVCHTVFLQKSSTYILTFAHYIEDLLSQITEIEFDLELFAKE
ncbi:MAG: hypothetical protein V7L20_15700, partial [Nostoc sp.]|uniref:hypothetical protein n=1 Tax=Nostoc sp. TaxID=1180 RepID=UPI002FF68FF7